MSSKTRSSRRFPAGTDPQEAIQQTLATPRGEFEKAPGAAPPRKRNYANSDTDLKLFAESIFEQDRRRDDDVGQDDLDVSEDDVAEFLNAKREAQRAVKGGEGDNWRVQQGGVVVTEKGRVKRWVRKPQQNRKGRRISTQDFEAAVQDLRFGQLDYEERVRRRIRSMLDAGMGGTGGATPERERAFIEGWKADRARRGWRIPEGL